MITLTATPPAEGYNLAKLQEEVLAAFAGRAMDCNEVDDAKALAVYLKIQQAADQVLFESTLADHDPDALTDAQGDSQAQAAAAATLASFAGRAYSSLLPTEQLQVITAVLQSLAFADTSGIITKP